MDFSILLKKNVDKVYLILWAPYGENDKNNIDLSIGLVLKEMDGLFVLSTDKEDNWSPKIAQREFPNSTFACEEFDNRVFKWQNCEIEDVITEEYYDFTDSNFFKAIVNQRISDIEWISVKENKPFGIKVKFENDYIISTPISDGNTIETKEFCLFRNMDIYRKLGEIKFISISNTNCP